MTAPELGDSFAKLLAAEAEKIGETVDVFVDRAVAIRLVQLLAARQDPKHGEVVDQLVDAHLLPEDPSASHRQYMIRNPDRLRALERTGLLQSAPADCLCRTVPLAAEALSVPSAAICVVSDDRQHVVCGIGLPDGMCEPQGVSLDLSIAKYMVASGRPLVIKDARADSTLKSHPMVVEGLLRSYLGVPLTSADGFTVGALCVWDNRPRPWSNGHVTTLRDLADVLAQHIFAPAARF